MIIALICAFAFSQSAFGSIPLQVLMKGQSNTVTVDYDIGDIAVADRDVCDYLVGQDRRSLYLSGRGGGETTVTLWDTDGKQQDEFVVRVVTTTLKEVLDRATGSFGDLRGVTVEVRGGRVEMGGEVAEPDDFRRIEAMARSDPRVRSRVRLSKDVVGSVADVVREAIDVPGVTVRAVRDRVVLEGVAYSAADAKRAVEIARLYTPDVLDLIEVRDSGRRVGQGKMIELEFHMVEVKKSALRSFGIQWAPGSFPNGGAATAATGNGSGLFSSIGELGKSLLGFVFQLVPKLKFIRERGDGRVLENPSVIVKSGEIARIFSGSEVPYYRNDSVEFKKVGIEIEAAPVEVKDGVDIKLTATLSAPSPDIRGAIDNNTVSTTAVCREGQSLALANVVRNGDVKMKNRAPSGIDTSSALFTLFLSKDFQSNRSTFVIFVTPRLVSGELNIEAEMRDFLAMEELMIRDRSKKEYDEFIKGKRVGTGGDLAPTKGRRRQVKRKWR